MKNDREEFSVKVDAPKTGALWMLIVIIAFTILLYAIFAPRSGMDDTGETRSDTPVKSELSSDLLFPVATISSNQEHPELRDGEVFLTNGTRSDYSQIGWKTKRMGGRSYDVNGKLVTTPYWLFPIFVQKSELYEAVELHKSTHDEWRAIRVAELGLPEETTVAELEEFLNKQRNATK